MKAKIIALFFSSLIIQSCINTIEYHYEVSDICELNGKQFIRIYETTNFWKTKRFYYANFLSEEHEYELLKINKSIFYNLNVNYKKGDLIKCKEKNLKILEDEI